MVACLGQAHPSSTQQSKVANHCTAVSERSFHSATRHPSMPGAVGVARLMCALKCSAVSLGNSKVGPRTSASLCTLMKRAASSLCDPSRPW
eukprot:6028244-Alexandrium_andersonii.AAC.1